MLLAGAISFAMMYYWHYPLVDMLWILLIVLIIFYIIGLLIQKRVNKFEEENYLKEQDEAAKEGAVIEKEANDMLQDETDDESGPAAGRMPGNMNGESGEGDSSGMFRSR